MKIRSITGFAGRQRRALAACEQFGPLLATARALAEEHGLQVQTTRLATLPLTAARSPSLRDPQALGEHAARVEEAATAAGIDYLALGPLGHEDAAHAAPALLAILAATRRIFVTLRYAETERGLSVPAARAAAEVIVGAAGLEENGFANLRFAALARVDAGVPFLPAAYAAAGEDGFAFALEAADLVRTSFSTAESVDDAVRRLVARIEAEATQLHALGERIARQTGLHFGGVDFSCAPFPTDADSIGAALESLGVVALGHPGSVTAAAVLTRAIETAAFERTGFSGLFLPVLEDARLAARAAEGVLRLEDLLLMSAVCGTGLDTVPLPGDVQAEELLPWLLDLGSLALRLDKPLTARLMPMPGRQAGDRLDFDFPFFASGRVMDLRRAHTEGALARAQWLPIAARRPRSR